MTRADRSKALWRSWLARRPVTAEVAGSSPVRVATAARHFGHAVPFGPGSSVGMSVRLKSGRSPVRSRPWPRQRLFRLVVNVTRRLFDAYTDGSIQNVGHFGVHLASTCRHLESSTAARGRAGRPRSVPTARSRRSTWPPSCGSCATTRRDECEIIRGSFAPRIRSAVVSIPRANSKTMMAATPGLAEMLSGCFCRAVGRPTSTSSGNASTTPSP